MAKEDIKLFLRDKKLPREKKILETKNDRPIGHFVFKSLGPIEEGSQVQFQVIHLAVNLLGIVFSSK